MASRSISTLCIGVRSTLSDCPIFFFCMLQCFSNMSVRMRGHSPRLLWLVFRLRQLYHYGMVKRREPLLISCHPMFCGDVGQTNGKTKARIQMWQRTGAISLSTCCAIRREVLCRLSGSHRMPVGNCYTAKVCRRIFRSPQGRIVLLQAGLWVILVSLSQRTCGPFTTLISMILSCCKQLAPICSSVISHKKINAICLPICAPQHQLHIPRPKCSTMARVLLRACAL
jgi:hypothetical protein